MNLKDEGLKSSVQMMHGMIRIGFLLTNIFEDITYLRKMMVIRSYGDSF